MEIIEILQEVISKLEELRIAYMVSGSAASSYHAFVRTTHDGDLVVALEPHQVDTFADAFQAEFYLDRASIRRALHVGSPFNLIHLKSSLKIDFFPLRKRPFSQQEFARRQPCVLAKDAAIPVYVATAEDTLIAKLEWFRAGGEVSENQWRDILGILKVQSGKLDLAYLRHWSEELDVDDLLTRAIREAEV